MPWPVHPTGFFGARGDNDTYRIERSLRFNSADSAYLSRTPASAGNRKTWTWSGWVKRGKLGTTQSLFARYTANTEAGLLTFIFWNDDTLRLAAGITDHRITTAKYRDVSSWYHLVLAVDTTQATANDRIKIYVNGEQVTSFSSTSNFTQNSDTQINDNVAHFIGYYLASVEFDGYLTEINFIDGQALTPSSFGETDAITGRWKAKAYSGTYGTNGFYLKFADNSGTTATTLGKDSSGNGNNWTPNNFSVADGTGNDSLLDSPTNSGTSGNYATLNPLKASSTSASISDGNLDVTFSQASQARRQGSLAVKTGKYYFETRIVSVGGNYPAVGVMLASTSDMNNYAGFETGTFGYYSGGGVNGGGAGRTYSTYTTDDIIGVALDLDNSQIVFYKNGVNAVTSGTLYESLTSGEIYVPAVSGFNGARLIVNFGQRPFAYTAPTGFKALCTTNLPTPTIKKPSSYMDVVTYTGNGTNRSISSLGFSPDFVWFKIRQSGSHALFDTTRGANKILSSNTTGSELTAYTDELTSFDSNGFTLGSSANTFTNTNGSTYVAWAWDEAPIAGMDIVSYTGDGNNNRSVPHNLGVVPSMVIIKSRNYGTAGWDWVVYHKSLNTSTEYLLLNSTAAKASASGLWAHTSSNLVFPTAYSTTNSAGVTSPYATFIAYLFAEVEGFSKFGSYTGNGSADGPFVFTGMRPRWVMVKRTDSTSQWFVLDTARNTFNVVDGILRANASDSESTGTGLIDVLSNGFKLRHNASVYSVNENGGSFIFAAFAESPFKYARAR